ncbi:uncharacterized protein [Solanum lycopersicum]|uniref:uncharacterized protein n=1 Tax=Solanum lycopersicum TaxID=4081 RepID=UPI003749B0B9
MAPFETLYGRRCRSPIGWFDAFEVIPWRTDLLKESLDKVKLIQDRLLMAQSRQKSYVDRKVRDLEFMDGERVLLKVSPMQGVHPVFHISMLKKYHQGGAHVIQWDSVLLDQNLTFEEEPITILDRQILKLRSKEIASVKCRFVFGYKRISWSILSPSLECLGVVVSCLSVPWPTPPSIF